MIEQVAELARRIKVIERFLTNQPAVEIDMSGGGGAPSNAQYVLVANDGTLPNDRALAGGDNVTLTDGGAGGSLTVDVSPQGAGSSLDADTVDGVELAGLVQTSRNLTAGVGLSGGGTLAADRTFNLDIDELTEESTPDAADMVAIYDQSAGAVRKQSRNNLLSGTTAAQASETAQGVIELATQAEVDAGTDDARAVTPLKLANVSYYRKKLTAVRTYYVNASTGSDSNDGLSSGTAFATIQKAIDVASGLDNGGNDITISIAAGTYTVANTLKSFVGSGSIIIVGDETTPSNVVVSTTSATCFSGDGVVGLYHLRGMRLQTTTGGNGITILNNTFLKFQNLDFGACVNNHMSITQGAFIQATGNYSITSNANRHHNFDIGGGAQITGRTVTLTGTPAFASAFCFMNTASYAALGGNTYSGSGTGTRYSVTLNSVCNVSGGGATYFPGNAAGATGTGGQYA